jgi:hypothetical protein
MAMDMQTAICIGQAAPSKPLSEPVSIAIRSFLTLVS